MFSCVAHPETNGQVEASNKVILDGLKKRLEDTKRRWVKELPSVFWAFRMTPRRSTGEMPYSLAYGTEAVIPLEVGLPTLRTMQVESRDNDGALEEALDFAEEKKRYALIRLADYHQSLSKQRQNQLNPREFEIESLVLRKNMGSIGNPTHGKLGANWEGPNTVTGAKGSGAYYLQD